MLLRSIVKGLSYSNLQYKNTNYNIEIAFSGMGEHGLASEIFAAIGRVNPQNRHRFSAVLDRAGIQSKKYHDVRTCYINMIGSHEFCVQFCSNGSANNGAINIFDYGIIGKLNEEKNNIDFLMVNHYLLRDKKIESKLLSN
ncbi:MAG: hypothetical protein KC505_10035 [Myxococcales bacterium]|nr:hypothetical protein [Myxococcales bacterium]